MSRTHVLTLGSVLLACLPALAQQRSAPTPRTTPTPPPRSTPALLPGALPPAARPSGTPAPAGLEERVVTERGQPTPAPKALHLDPSRQDLPYHHEAHPLGRGTTSFSAHLTGTAFRPMERAEVEALPGLDPRWTEPFVATRLGRHRKDPVALVDIYPYRRNAVTGQWERLTDFQLQLVEGRGGMPAGRPKSYPPSSRFSTGTWYRVQVVQDGVHALPYELLEGMGLSGEVPSDQVNLYGRHHGMLPFENEQLPATDVVPNAVVVDDGGDGAFGPGDRILFYATGPQRWDLDGGTGRYRHTKHVFTDSASYFVGIGVEDPVRVATLPQVTDGATRTSTSFDDRQFLETDAVTLLKSGRELFGDAYDLTTTYSYNFSMPFLRPQDPACLVMDVLSRTLGTGNASSWRVVSGLALDTSVAVQGVPTGYTGEQAKATRHTFCFNGTGNNVPFTVTFNKHNPASSVGWMNALELHARRDLRMVGNQLLFRDLTSVGAGEITDFVLEQASGALTIWDITEPTAAAQVPFTENGAQKLFRLRTDSLRQFVAFRTSGLLTPSAAGAVPNQDLHATPLPTDLVIVTPDAFRPAAQRIAERRAGEGLNVRMVSPQEVYNEFSAGMRDATAIKRYMKLLYDRAGSDQELMPRYLLLFGDGSYNNLNRAASNQSFLPSYQTANSWHASLSYCSDDYFALLDDEEGEYQGDLVDIGVGRIPVSSVAQAQEMADKVLNYDRLQLLTSGGDQCAVGSDGGANDWRTWLLFASDDQEGDAFESTVHMSQSDALATTVENQYPCYNLTKVYLDAYQQSSTPGGERYFQAQADLRDGVQRGALLVNYVGHGGEVGWAHERFLDNNTILGWTNSDRLPLFMTATCEFSRWDDPARTSAGEYVLLNPRGGGIGLMTTTRIAYSNQNYALSQDFYDHVFERTDEMGRPAALGDVFRRTKVDITTAQPSQVNHRNFTLLGDPSLRLAMPRNEVRITAITDTLGAPLDTLQALGTVRITGEVVDPGGDVLTGLNGVVVPTVFDKRVQQQTLANDGGSPFPFSIRKNIIYRGKASVSEGRFDFTFVVPRDINYAVGPGRVSCYVEGLSDNGCGATNEPLVGGTATNVALDEQGPDVQVYLNDERFVRGGLTNEAPLLLVKLFDANGINTMGSSIGHDLVAVLDENTDQAIVLNDQYEADLDTYRSGTARYRFDGLAEGGHTLRVKAWDVFNNSAEASTEFVVAPSAELALDHVLNYPNPFTTSTQFFFEHNRPCSTLDVQVQVFTVSGRLVKTLDRQLACEGFRSEPLAWDGCDDQGDKLGRGVYVYRLNVVTSEGEKAEKLEKLVILR